MAVTSKGRRGHPARLLGYPNDTLGVPPVPGTRAFDSIGGVWASADRPWRSPGGILYPPRAALLDCYLGASFRDATPVMVKIDTVYDGVTNPGGYHVIAGVDGAFGPRAGLPERPVVWRGSFGVIGLGFIDIAGQYTNEIEPDGTITRPEVVDEIRSDWERAAQEYDAIRGLFVEVDPPGDGRVTLEFMVRTMMGSAADGCQFGTLTAGVTESGGDYPAFAEAAGNLLAGFMLTLPV